MKLICLKAEYGDAFIIEIGEASEKHYIVVDSVTIIPPNKRVS